MWNWNEGAKITLCFSLSSLFTIFYPLSWQCAWGHPFSLHHGFLRPGRGEMMCELKILEESLWTILLLKLVFYVQMKISLCEYEKIMVCGILSLDGSMELMAWGRFHTLVIIVVLLSWFSLEKQNNQMTIRDESYELAHSPVLFDYIFSTWT